MVAGLREVGCIHAAAMSVADNIKMVVSGKCILWGMVLGLRVDVRGGLSWGHAGAELGADSALRLPHPWAVQVCQGGGWGGEG